GIRATTILPGETDTPILDNRARPPSAQERAAMLQPEDVAAAVVLAASLSQRAVIEELRIAPTRLRDTSEDIEAARWAGAPLDPGQVLVTHGASGGLAAAISAIVDPGDVVVLPDPTYSLYADAVHLAGGTTRPVPSRADLHWDLDRLADALRGVKLFVFCNP